MAAWCEPFNLADWLQRKPHASGTWIRLYFGGRTLAHQLFWLGSSRALCQLEKHVHLNGAMPRAASLALMRLVIPPHTRPVQASDLGLPDDWRLDVAATQKIGMTWLQSRAGLEMWVPSFVEPAENNLILNPAHRAYEAVQLVIEQNPFAFDPRLFG